MEVFVVSAREDEKKEKTASDRVKKKKTHSDQRHGKGRGGQHQLQPDQLVAVVVELDVDVVLGVVDVLAEGLEAVEGVVDLEVFFFIFFPVVVGVCRRVGEKRFSPSPHLLPPSLPP